MAGRGSCVCLVEEQREFVSVGWTVMEVIGIVWTYGRDRPGRVEPEDQASHERID